MLRAASAPTHSSVARNPPRHPSVGIDSARISPSAPLATPEGEVFVHADGRRKDDQDVILDFRPGTDKIDLSCTARFGGADLDDVLASAEQIGRDVVTDMGEGNGTLTLENVDVDALSEDDFIF